MSVGRAFVIARANLVRLLRDRLGLFFIVVLPLMIIFVTGLQFGGGFESRVGLLGDDAGPLATDLAERLDEHGVVEVPCVFTVDRDERHITQIDAVFQFARPDCWRQLAGLMQGRL